MEYRILGPLEVLRDGEPVAVGGSRQRALLAVLLMHANTVVSRDRLIDEVWGAEPPETAATVVQVYVSQLRKALGRDAIVTRSPGYVIRPDDGELDLDRFQRLVEKAGGREPDVAADLLRQALGLWRGTPLAELEGPLAQAEQARLEEERLLALEQRIDADLELGRHAALVPELEGLVRQHPLRERLRGQLMLALYQSGRQADALETYRQGRRHLDQELGLEPSEDLRRLERAILEHDPAIGAPAASFERRLLDASGRRWRLLVAFGALLIAGALAGVLVEVTSSGSAPVAVEENSVAVVDAKTGRVVADVAIGGRPIAMAVGAGAVWVVDGDDGTLVRIDPKTRKTHVIGIGSDVSGVAVGRGSVWVAGGNTGTLTRVCPDTGQVCETLWYGNANDVVARPVFFVATGVDGGLWASRGQRLLRLDARMPDRVLRDVAVPGGLSQLAVGEGNAWAATWDDHLLRIDAGTGLTTPSHLTRPQALTVYRGWLWLVDFQGNTPTSPVKGQIWRVDPDTLDVRETTPVPSGYPIPLTAGEGAVWTADKLDGTVWRVDPVTSDISRVTTVSHEPISIAAAFGAVWVGVQGSD